MRYVSTVTKARLKCLYMIEVRTIIQPTFRGCIPSSLSESEDTIMMLLRSSAISFNGRLTNLVRFHASSWWVRN